MTGTDQRLGHCTPLLGGHSPACDRDGTYCALASTHEGPCKPHGQRAEPCLECEHPAHSERGCSAIVDTGWTWHGCHCTTSAAAPATWTHIVRPDGASAGYFCGFTYPGDSGRWHDEHSAEGRTCRGYAPSIWDRFTEDQLRQSAAAQARDRAR
jgi:hypothetical protein